MTTASLPICPLCKQTDQVQKVSNLYQLNTKEWIETDSWIDIDGETHYTDEKHQAHTLLGLKLKPPEKPSPPAHPAIGYGLGLLGILIVLSIFCSIAIIPILVVTGILTDQPLVIPDIFGIPAWMILTVAGGFCFLLIVTTLVWVGIRVKRRYTRALAGFQEKKIRYESEDLYRWESAMRRWNELYFCLRDETVFLLGEQKVIPLEDLPKYLLYP